MTQAAGIVHWIDHFVCCTNDVERWYRFNERVLGAKTIVGDFVWSAGIGVFQDIARSRIGGFGMHDPLPPTHGLGQGLPRFGYYIEPAQIEAHVRRLRETGAVHAAPQRIEHLGEPGVSIPWQDPDGNQFEFWAPDAMPAGAMTERTPAGVGRISHGVFESRDLARTAAMFARYCGLEGTIAGDTLVLRLGSGGRMLFQRVAELQGRTTGMGLLDAHTALLVREEDYFPNYRRVWAELPEYEFDPMAQKHVSAAERAQLPPRTVLHPSPGGRRFHALTQRGDDFFDWDSNMFHFFGGVPLGDTMAVYEGRSIEYYTNRLEAEHAAAGSIASVLTA